MCTLCVVYKTGQDIPIERWNNDALNTFRRMVQMAERLDYLTGQPDCHDPEKAKWLEKLESYLS